MALHRMEAYMLSKYLGTKTSQVQNFDGNVEIRQWKETLEGDNLLHQQGDMHNLEYRDDLF